METTGARKLELKTQLHVVKYSLRVQKFSARWSPGGAGPPNVNLGPPDISETTRARKLNLKIPLDMVKYPYYRIRYKNYYIIRHNIRTAAILIFDKCLSPRHTTANNCKTAFSLHVVESASDDYNF